MTTRRALSSTFLVKVTLAVCLLLLAYAFRSVLVSLILAWQRDEYSHGFLIPAIALLIGWDSLRRHLPIPCPSWWGVACLLAGGFLLFAGQLAAFEAAADYGLIVCLYGLGLGFVGRRAAFVLLPAYLYLLFAVPLPSLVYVNLSQELQLLSSSLGVAMLDMAGIPVFQDGNVIDLGSIKLQVVEACNGLRYLFPLLSFGYLIAYLLDDAWWKRIVLLLSAIPITLLMNSLRIAVIGVTVALWGESMAEGLIHEFEGWVVFILCVLLLLAEARLLQAGAGCLRLDIFAPGRGPLLSGAMAWRPPVVAALLACASMAGLFGTSWIEGRREIIPSHPPFATFPLVLGAGEAWRATPLALEPLVLEALQLNDYWLADYRRAGDASPINFYLAYNGSQHIGTAAHTPSHCIPGGGWHIADKSVISLAVGQERLRVTRLLITKGSLAQLVYYWFEERGRNLTETYSAKWYLFWDAITLHRTDGALVRYVTPLARGESEADADVRLNAFVAASLPAIRRFVPGNDISLRKPDL